MPTYRPTFYNEDPHLSSFEILTWASKKLAFTAREVLEHFEKEFRNYNDVHHEVSERLRKLLKSEMILVVTEGEAKAMQSRDIITKEEEKTLIDLLTTLSDPEIRKREGRRGPIPRLYKVTIPGEKYVKNRLEEERKKK